MEYKFKVKGKTYKIRKQSVADWLCTTIMVAIASGVITFIAMFPSIVESIL